MSENERASAKLRAKVNLLNALLSFSVGERERGQREAAEQIGKLNRQVDELRRQVEEADRLREECERQKLHDMEELNSLRGSTSWRLTAPIRIIGRLLK